MPFPLHGTSSDPASNTQETRVLVLGSKRRRLNPEAAPFIPGAPYHAPHDWHPPLIYPRSPTTADGQATEESSTQAQPNSDRQGYTSFVPTTVPISQPHTGSPPEDARRTHESPETKPAHPDEPSPASQQQQPRDPSPASPNFLNPHIAAALQHQQAQQLAAAKAQWLRQEEERRHVELFFFAQRRELMPPDTFQKQNLVAVWEQRWRDYEKERLSALRFLEEQLLQQRTQREEGTRAPTSQEQQRETHEDAGRRSDQQLHPEHSHQPLQLARAQEHWRRQEQERLFLQQFLNQQRRRIEKEGSPPPTDPNQRAAEELVRTARDSQNLVATAAALAISDGAPDVGPTPEARRVPFLGLRMVAPTACGETCEGTICGKTCPGMWLASRRLKNTLAKVPKPVNRRLKVRRGAGCEGEDVYSDEPSLEGGEDEGSEEEAGEDEGSEEEVGVDERGEEGNRESVSDEEGDEKVEVEFSVGEDEGGEEGNGESDSGGEREDEDSVE
ncbi:hypothetical protein N657DRAFT_637828 [Parathielavia appendiculata]|uniref:Uncharacterized protein n=1 Tax=Parathielavia appendiculata TaxID=2587402 RepID=A0AAN6TR21_9PEZI|nr:hypothetical protein N657DRAFT_637828 [Parathielavia appendiculata]